MHRFFGVYLLVCLGTACSSHEVCDETAARSASELRRDPQTLVCVAEARSCESSGNSGGAQPDSGIIWGACGGTCEQLDETACGAADECRVVKDSSCVAGGDCQSSFVGCFAITKAIYTKVECGRADAWNCSRDPGCTAFHSVDPACTTADCARPFSFCAQDGIAPGRCWEPVSCPDAAPECPASSTPGVAGGCFTGACIPLSICEPA